MVLCLRERAASLYLLQMRSLSKKVLLLKNRKFSKLPLYRLVCLSFIIRLFSFMSNDSFWNFSCSAYRGFEQEFLLLQDSYGLQVNMLLLCGFLGRSGYEIRDVSSLMEVCYEWEDFLVSLRRLRKAVKGRELYSRCKALELQFEACYQSYLLEQVPNFCIRDGLFVRENIVVYLSYVKKKQKLCWSDLEIRVIVSRLENCEYL